MGRDPAYPHSSRVKLAITSDISTCSKPKTTGQSLYRQSRCACNRFMTSYNAPRTATAQGLCHKTSSRRFKYYFQVHFLATPIVWSRMKKHQSHARRHFAVFQWRYSASFLDIAKDAGCVHYLPYRFFYAVFVICTMLLVGIVHLEGYTDINVGMPPEMLILWAPALAWKIDLLLAERGRSASAACCTEVSGCLLDVAVQAVVQIARLTEVKAGMISGEAILTILPGASNRVDMLLESTFVAICLLADNVATPVQAATQTAMA
eukprot:5328767-Amphidinium_carterae.1